MRKHTQQANVTNKSRAVDVKGLEDRVEDGVERSLQLRAVKQTADTVGVSRGILAGEVGVRDGRSRDHRGSKGQDGEDGELHFDCFVLKSKKT